MTSQSPALPPSAFSSRAGLFASLAGLLALSVAAAGCGIRDCGGKEEIVKEEVVCESSGAVRVASPTLALPETIGLSWATPCLTASGACDGPATAAFAGHNSTSTVTVSIDVAPTVVPGTYALTGNGTAEIVVEVDVSSAADGYPLSGVVRSGELRIQRNDAGGFAGTFAFEVETGFGHHVSLTGGGFDLHDCELESQTYCLSSET